MGLMDNITPSSLAVGLHYQLEAYICGPACVRASPFGEGWTTFWQIFQHRPDGCRFAVARALHMVSVGTGISSTIENRPADSWVVWDLFVDQLTRGRSFSRDILHPPPPLWEGEHLDALIMKAMALYERA